MRPRIYRFPGFLEDGCFPLNRPQPACVFLSSNSLDAWLPGAREPPVKQDLQMFWDQVSKLDAAALPCTHRHGGNHSRKEREVGRGISLPRWSTFTLPTSLPPNFSMCLLHPVSTLSMARGRWLKENEIVSAPQTRLGAHSLVFPKLPCVWFAKGPCWKPDADSVGLRQDSRICIPNQLPGATGFASREPHFEQQGPTLDCMEQFLAYYRGRIWFSNTPLPCQTEKCAKHSTGKTAQQIGVDVGEVFQQVSHSLYF